VLISPPIFRKCNCKLPQKWQREKEKMRHPWPWPTYKQQSLACRELLLSTSSTSCSTTFSDHWCCKLQQHWSTPWCQAAWTTVTHTMKCFKFISVHYSRFETRLHDSWPMEGWVDLGYISCSAPAENRTRDLPITIKSDALTTTPLSTVWPNHTYQTASSK